MFDRFYRGRTPVACMQVIGACDEEVADTARIAVEVEESQATFTTECVGL